MTNTIIRTPDHEIVYMDKIALIDADFIKYIVTYRISQNVSRMEDGTTPTDELIDTIKDVMSNILLGVECKARIYCFSGTTKKGFRYALAREKEYKASRKIREPLYEGDHLDAQFTKEYICENNYHLVYDDLEADDILSMLQCNETFIYSKDKDLLQMPGTHYDINKSEFITVEPTDAWRFLMYQSIGGDSTDNILGLKGYGITKLDKEGNVKSNGKVNKILDEIPAGHLHFAVIQEYVDQLGSIKQGLDAFVENYSLVRLTLNRGAWVQEKYKEAFTLLNTLKLVK